MTVHEATGDLFYPSGWTTIGDSWSSKTVDCIGHGVNCKGAMGSGIAVPFRQKYPDMYTRYRDMCDKHYLLPGMVMPYHIGNGAWIFNIASQYHPGPDAHLNYLDAGLRYCAFFMEHVGLKHLGLPRIGAGIGGLSYETVYATVVDVFGESDTDVTIVSLEGA